MDDLTLIGHMAGGGEALAQQLREKGFGDVGQILGQEPSLLAQQLAIDEDTAKKIIAAAKALAKPKGIATEPSVVSDGAKAEEPTRVAVVEEKPRVKKAATAKTRKRRPAPVTGTWVTIRRKRYWKVVLPLLGGVLIGSLLNQG